MLTVKVDPHTHTLFSGHAFGTIEENVRRAAEMGLEAIAWTDHFSAMFTPVINGFPQMGGMMNLTSLPKTCLGIRVYAGVEIDIADKEGHLAFWDFASPFGPPPGKKPESGRKGPRSFLDFFLASREFSIASVHMRPGQIQGTEAEFTDMYINVMQDSRIHAIGHPIRARYPFDWAAFLEACRLTHTLPEINEHTMDLNDEFVSTLRTFAEACARDNVPVIVSSDAHSSFHVGGLTRSLALLEEIGFPQELIANRDMASFEAAIAAKSGKAPDR